MGAGIIISETQPEALNRYTWSKPLPDGGKEWYEPSDGGWALVRADFAPAAADHSHATLGNLDLTGTLSVNGDNGVTGTRTVGGFTFTFKNGILTGFAQA